MSKKIKNIYLAESVPSLNKGEEAILRGIYQGFKMCGIEPELSVLSYTPEIDRKRYSEYFKVVDGISFRPLKGSSNRPAIIKISSLWVKHFFFLILWRLIGPRSLYFFRKGNWRAYAEADLILTGHDGVISDLNLLFALYVGLLKKRSAIFGGGFNKFRLRFSEKIAPYALSKLDSVTVRQKSTYDYLILLGIKRDHVEWRPDPAFLMEPIGDIEVEKLMHLERIDKAQRPLIGMIVVKGSIVFDKCFYRIPDRQKRYSSHIQFMARFCEYIIDVTNGTVVFLPHCIGPGIRDDRICARDIYNQMDRNQGQVILIENEYNAATLKGLISKLDFIISERLHAIIAAASVGTPFIAITVEEDIRTQDIISETVGMEELIFNINDPSFSEFTKKFEVLYSKRHVIRSELLETSKKMKERCYLGFRKFVENFKD